MIAREARRAMNPTKASVSTGNQDWPRISLVTPVLNAVRYIEQTLQSVISQRYPNLEYVVVDGGSIDGTVDIIRSYEKQLSWWTSEPDNGHFDALNKGFAHTSGEIMGWINGNDQLHVGGLRVVGSVFEKFPEIRWITGLPTSFSEEGMTISVKRGVPRWSHLRFLSGANRYIQQESTFWRRSLWLRAGGYVDSSRRIASDFELWARFFRHARLYSINALIGGYRWHPDSVSSLQLDACHRIHDEVVEAELDKVCWGRAVKVFRTTSRFIMRIPKVRALWLFGVMSPLYSLPGPDWPPCVEYCNQRGWIMRN
jgi:hypothetical protein